MIVTFFNRNNVGLFPIGLLLAAVLWAWSFVVTDTAVTVGVKLHWLDPSSWSSWLSITLSWVVLLMMLVWIKVFSDDCGLQTNRNFLPLLIAAILVAIVPQWLLFNETLLAVVFVLVAVHQLRKLHNVSDGRSASFNAGLAIGIAGMFYVYAFLFIAVLIIGLILFRPMIWREWILGLIGVGLPLVYLGAAGYLLEVQPYTVVDSTGIQWALEGSHRYLMLIISIPVALLAIAGLVSLKASTKLVSNGYFLLAIVAAIATVISIIDTNGSAILLATIPLLATSSSRVLSNTRKPGLVNSLFWLGFLAVAAYEVVTLMDYL